MSFILKRVTATKLSGFEDVKVLYKVLYKNNVFKNQTATLTRVAYRDENEIPLQRPMQYHNKKFHFIKYFFNLIRLHKHSKIIVVDGPVACGKSKFAQDLAKEFDFLYLPEPTFDDLFITPYGFDARTLDCKLPKEIQSWDIERFLHHPNDVNTPIMQHHMYIMRQYSYLNAINHVLFTGQGVVTVRSPWSDKAFATAMYRSNYVTKADYETYMQSYWASLGFLLRPHLLIYLDVPVHITIENIKKHGKPFEKTSKVLENEKYLTDIENGLKYDCFKLLNPHTLRLVYDWSGEVDFEGVLDDIENLNFDDHLTASDILVDWRLGRHDLIKLISRYTSQLPQTFEQSDVNSKSPAFYTSAENMKKWNEVWSEIDDGKYIKGYNVLKEDVNVLYENGLYKFKDYVTPLIQKYKERKAKLKWYQRI